MLTSVKGVTGLVHERRRDRGVSTAGSAVTYALLASVLAVDLLVPLGIAAAMLYIPVVLVAIRLASARTVAVVAGAAVVLTGLGLWLSPTAPPGVPDSYVLGNRLVTMVAIAACGWMGWTVLHARRRLEHVNASLHSSQADLAQQAELAGIAGEVGKVGGWTMDIGSQTARWSDEVARILGFGTGGDFDVEFGLDHYVPEDRDRIRGAVELCSTEGVPFDEELRMETAAGELIWVNSIGRAERDESGSIVRLVGAFQDITRRKALEQAADESSQRLRMMADSMPLIVWTADQDGRIDYFSKALLTYTGAAADELRDDTWASILHPEDLQRCLDNWALSISSGEPFVMDMRVRRQDGSFRWQLLRAVPERSRAGDVVRWWGSATDIHDLRMLETEASDLARQLTDTLESIGDAVLSLDRQWTVRFVNAHAERLLQHPRGEILGRNIWEVFPEAVGSVFQTEYERAVSERRPARFGAPFAPLGIYAEVSAYPHERGLTIYFRDITEQRALAEQLAFARKQPLDPGRVDLDELVTDTLALLARTLGDPDNVDGGPAHGNGQEG